MGKRQGQNSHRHTQRCHVTFLFSPPFPLFSSFHPSLWHIQDQVINLVEISLSLINAFTPPPHPIFSSRLVFLFWLYGGYTWFFPRAFISSFPLLSSSADKDEVMCSVIRVWMWGLVDPSSLLWFSYSETFLIADSAVMGQSLRGKETSSFERCFYFIALFVCCLFLRRESFLSFITFG